MNRRLLSLLALACLSPFALAQDVVSYDPKVLADSFVALGGLVGVVTQMIKTNVLEKVAEGLREKPSRWVTLLTSLLVAEVLAFLLQFVLGGITDAQFAGVNPPALKAAAYGGAAWLFISGFVAAARSTGVWVSALVLTYKVQKEQRTAAAKVVKIGDKS